MSEIALNLIVVRSAQLEATRRFYEALGLVFVDEQHGQGPAHLSATLASGLVFELYPSTSTGEVLAGTPADVRLGFIVSDVESVLEAATRAGGTYVSRDENRAVVAGPDGRKVELVQDLSAICEAYWRHYENPDEEVWARDLVDDLGRGRWTGPPIRPLQLFAELATGAPDDSGLAHLGAGPLEDYLKSEALDLELLAPAVRDNDNLARAFRCAYLPRDLPPERIDRLRTILQGSPS